MTIIKIKPSDEQEPTTKLRGKGAPIDATTNPKQIADPIANHQMLFGIFLPKRLGKPAITANAIMIKVKKDTFISRFPLYLSPNRILISGGIANRGPVVRPAIPSKL